jgi:hypothetical protein
MSGKMGLESDNQVYVNQLQLSCHGLLNKLKPAPEADISAPRPRGPAGRRTSADIGLLTQVAEALY